MKKLYILISLSIMSSTHSINMFNFPLTGFEKFKATIGLLSRFSFLPQACNKKSDSSDSNKPLPSSWVREFTPACNETLNTILSLCATLEDMEEKDSSFKPLSETLMRQGNFIVRNCKGQNIGSSPFVKANDTLQGFVAKHPHLFPTSHPYNK